MIRFRLSSDPQGRLNYGGEAEIESNVMVKQNNVFNLKLKTIRNWVSYWLLKIDQQ